MNLSGLFNHRRNMVNTTAVSNAMDTGEIKEIIAWELMLKIAEAESKNSEKKDMPREYYLTLYSQCLQTVSGDDVEDVLEDCDD
jgi:hypothetical protein